jgi:hypothetical protein
VIFSISLISCDNSEEDNVQFLEEMEDAQAIAISLDTLKNALISEVSSNGYQSYTIYPVSLNIDGISSGNATLVGADTVSGVGGHSGGFVSKRANVNFELDGYSNSNSVVLESGGNMTYRNLHVSRSSYCSDPSQCPSQDIKDTLEINATGLSVSITSSEKKIRDVIDITFLYTRSFESIKDVVNDSSHYNHYKITTSKGLVFEW